MRFDLAVVNNETKELVNRDIKLICTDKDKHIYRPEEGYSLVINFGGLFVVNTNEEPTNSQSEQ